MDEMISRSNSPNAFILFSTFMKYSIPSDFGQALFQLSENVNFHFRNALKQKWINTAPNMSK